ncbi:GumC family protein [Abyssalbus ytuae]|uniref:non-specific protein-tyrosine kinase n=1 Tax=Abyssalbus ytuae TaxID=2926907 RepID=A0A9E6ZUN9_9FLAO|nr:polysaccharide biosynthesis tyrosine autokinase [Abyssalbus ytuae]UOB17086.1 polysaccharide biosynthesis tyrosine autokinase [Abyssalbus ytuae]
MNNKIDLNSGNYNRTNFQEIIRRYVQHWKWFLLSVITLIVLTYLYIRYATPQYGASATVMMTEDPSSSPEMAIFEDLEGFNSNAEKIEDEIQIMKSRSLMTEVVKKLALNYQYYISGRVKETEIYKSSPIKINFLESDLVIDKSYFDFYIEIKSETNLVYSTNKDEEGKSFAFGQDIPTPFSTMVIVPNADNFDSYIGKKVRVSITPVNQVADYYTTNIIIQPTLKGSNVLEITLSDRVKEKAIDIINTLIYIYSERSIEEKSRIAKKTASFINERIQFIAGGLSEIDSSAVTFKSTNRLTNIASETDIYLNASSEAQQQLNAAATELNMVNYMKDYLKEQDSPDVLPALVGLSDPTINEVLANYNELVLERQRLLKSSSEKHPVIVNLDQQLKSLKQTMVTGLNNISNTLNIRVDNLRNQESRINSKIYTVPGKEKRLRDIQREQGIKESLYLYLLQKREEAAIASASVSPNIRIIDPAIIKNTIPVYPNQKVIYVASLVLGFIIPFLVIYLNDLFNTEIHNKEDVVKIADNIPFLAEIPKIKKDKLLIEKNDRSVLAESFRILRTNLDYFISAKSKKEGGEVIFVTSTISGEGKSFVSCNLALTLAYSHKKVLLIRADIRKADHKNYLKDSQINPLKGLAEYLYGKYSVEEVIQPFADDASLDIITSGQLPPNPAELLMTDKTDKLFKKVSKDYDFIIVDTAPSMLVTDTLLISQFADRTIYVCRSAYTDKRLLSFPIELKENSKLKGMMMVINDVKETNFGYGNKYGRAYGKKGK